MVTFLIAIGTCPLYSDLFHLHYSDAFAFFVTIANIHQHTALKLTEPAVYSLRVPQTFHIVGGVHVKIASMYI